MIDFFFRTKEVTKDYEEILLFFLMSLYKKINTFTDCHFNNRCEYWCKGERKWENNIKNIFIIIKFKS